MKIYYKIEERFTEREVQKYIVSEQDYSNLLTFHLNISNKIVNVFNSEYSIESYIEFSIRKDGYWKLFVR